MYLSSGTNTTTLYKIIGILFFIFESTWFTKRKGLHTVPTLCVL